MKVKPVQPQTFSSVQSHYTETTHLQEAPRLHQSSQYNPLTGEDHLCWSLTRRSQIFLAAIAKLTVNST